jgi:ketosteroid isomerase-like protein
MSTRCNLAIGILTGMAITAFAQTPARDSATVLAVVGAFHGALARGDSPGALALLASDVMILESGYAEMLDDYRAHHLPADIEFARATSTTRTVSRVVVLGDAAWLTAASVTRGNFRGREINSRGVELVVLGRQAGAWKIRAVHWSSQRR